jgi:predicted alpha/beta-fold hydrolase
MASDGKYRPILFVVPGLTSTSQSGYVRGIVSRAVKEGYDVIVINYRGMAGAKLTTDKLFSSNSVDDILEPMRYYYDRYQVKAMAIGCSMGAGLLANIIGGEADKCFLEAACLI